MQMIHDAKTWINRNTYISELEIQFRDAEWDNNMVEANWLRDIINTQRSLISLDGELIVPF
jgi:hypothetical protein